MERLSKQFRQLMRMVEHHVRRSFAQRVRSEAVGHAAGPHAGVASGKDVHRGIADDYGLLRLSPGFLEQERAPSGSGFLVGKLLPP